MTVLYNASTTHVIWPGSTLDCMHESQKLIHRLSLSLVQDTLGIWRDHSQLNHVVVPLAIQLFMFVQSLENFFSSSIHRWTVMVNCLKSDSAETNQNSVSNACQLPDGRQNCPLTISRRQAHDTKRLAYSKSCVSMKKKWNAT
jgi:hypothetical protein